MVKIKHITLGFLLASFGVSYAQNVGINTDGSTPGMMLDVKVPSGDDGIRINNNSGTGDALINLQDAGSSAWTFGMDASNANRLVFDNGGALTTTNVMVLETGGDVGIGINNPTAMLVVNQDAIFNESGGTNDFRVESDTRTHALFVDAANNVVRVGTSAGSLNGNTAAIYDYTGGYITTIDYVADFDNGTTMGTGVGIGSIELLIDGSNEIFLGDADYSPAVDASWDLGYSNSWRYIYAYGFYNVSDSLLKQNIMNLDYGLDDILKINTYQYTYKADEANTPHIGFMAQDMDKVIPELVQKYTYKPKSEDEPDVMVQVPLKNMRVNYVELIPVLTKAIQEQQELIEELMKRVALLESK